MFSLGTIAGQFRNFGRDRGGNFGLAFAGVSTMLLLGIGYGINVGQIHSAKSALLNALDAAVTSTARDITTGKITKEQASEVVQAFLLTNAQNSTLRGLDVKLASLDIDDEKKTVSGTATVDTAMFFPVFNGGDRQHIESRSTAVYSDKKVEVVMMLDVTGSMKGEKLKGLKEAASNAVDSFFEMQDLKKTRVRVAMVPYSTAVNAGKLAPSSVFVETEKWGRKPAPGNGEPRLVSNTASSGSCATERKGTYAFSDVGPDRAMVSRDLWHRALAGAECPSVAIVPLTTDGDAIKSKISLFTAAGSTAGHIGIQWSWYMLSPEWSGVLAKSERPAAYDEKKTTKIAILMTDGNFNIEFAGAPSKNDVFEDWRGSDASKRSMTTAKRLCTEMKKDKIEIFTIGFGLGTKDTDAKATLADCATSGGKHYFEAADSEELDETFQTIARNIEKLALTQ